MDFIAIRAIWGSVSFPMKPWHVDWRSQETEWVIHQQEVGWMTHSVSRVTATPEYMICQKGNALNPPYPGSPCLRNGQVKENKSRTLQPGNTLYISEVSCSIDGCQLGKHVSLLQTCESSRAVVIHLIQWSLFSMAMSLKDDSNSEQGSTCL